METNEQEVAYDKLQAAHELLERGHLEAAHSAFADLLSGLPAPEELRGPAEAGLAQVCLEQGRLHEAMAHGQRARDLGQADGLAVIGEILRRQGDRDGAADAFLSAYIQEPFDWTRLATYCELTGRPHRDPSRDGHQPPANPFARLWLYRDLLGQLAETECGHTFTRTARLAREHGIDAIELFQVLNHYDVWCDCEASGAWAHGDHGAQRVWLAGWFEGRPDLVDRLLRARVLRETTPEEIPDQEIEEATADKEGDVPIVQLRIERQERAGKVPPQLVEGFYLRDTFVHIKANLREGEQAAFFVGFVDTEEPPAAIVVTTGAVEMLDLEGVRSLDSRDRGRIDDLTKYLDRYKPPAINGQRDVPTEDEQNWLRENLRELIKHAGAEPFVRPPLNPDDALTVWRPNADGMSALIGWLMQHAGLGALKVNLIVGRPEALPNDVILGWFAGIEGNTAHFGCDIQLHDEPENVLGTLSHEVAHAWREHHGLRLDDRELEEKLTDLTAVYLGFGVAVTNASFQYRASGVVMGGTVIHQWKYSRAGYLPAQALGYLLAVQSRCRREGMFDRRRLAANLEVTQRHFYKAAIKALPEDEELLRGELGIPRWAGDFHDQRRPVETARRQPLVATSTTVEWNTQDGPPKFNEGRPVFRVPTKKLGGKTLLLIMGGFVLFIVVGVATKDLAVSMTAGLVAATAAFVFGPRVRYDQCADVECEEIIPAGATICPRCGGTVSGTIKNASDRLEAEEALFAEKLRNTGRAAKSLRTE
ncbi:MAG: hypothetical protein A2289_00640 [Deltaproteobacteria bacterium RIFOXYA12_FULL_58_15]|nr:MAG: hypothetical protein A2289_00640 [Deltaproteobacteria bacterium RIFOXYA12_FULL_58_15]